MTKEERPHEWIEFHGLPCCRRCGTVKRKDGKNKPCKGPVKIALREAQNDPETT